MTSEPSRTAEAHIIAWSFVAAQAVLLIAIVFIPRGGAWVSGSALRFYGSLLMGLGVVLGLWAAAYLGRGLTPSPLPNGATTLVTKGPYRFVRHPIYTAVMLLCAGITIRADNWLVLGAYVALVVLFQFKARWEERHLSGSFQGYAEYMENTGRFLPVGRGERNAPV